MYESFSQKTWHEVSAQCQHFSLIQARYDLSKILPEEKNLMCRISHYFCQVSETFGAERVKLPVLFNVIFCPLSHPLLSLSLPLHIFWGVGNEEKGAELESCIVSKNIGIYYVI